MYVKVYISRMEMTQKSQFWHQNLIKIYIFLRKWQTITFLVKKVFEQPTKRNFELKMIKLHDNHLKTNIQEGFSHFYIFLDSGLNFDKFGKEITFLAHSGQNLQTEGLLQAVEYFFYQKTDFLPFSQKITIFSKF